MRYIIVGTSDRAPVSTSMYQLGETDGWSLDPDRATPFSKETAARGMGVRHSRKLRESGAPLPREGRKPNKVAIAASCGFGRHILSRPMGEAMLAEFDREDRARHSIDVADYAGSLRSYLAEPRASGKGLPCCGGQRNKRAIPDACGFSRNLLYTDEVIAGLLADHLAG